MARLVTKVAATAMLLSVGGCGGHPDAVITDRLDNPFLRNDRPATLEDDLMASLKRGADINEVRDWMALRGAPCDEPNPEIKFFRCRYKVRQGLFYRVWLVDVYFTLDNRYQFVSVRQALSL